MALAVILLTSTASADHKYPKFTDQGDDLRKSYVTELCIAALLGKNEVTINGTKYGFGVTKVFYQKALNAAGAKRSNAKKIVKDAKKDPKELKKLKNKIFKKMSANCTQIKKSEKIDDEQCYDIICAAKGLDEEAFGLIRARN